MENIDPIIPFEKATSSREGVSLQLAKFKEKSDGKIPFKGGRFIVEALKTSSLDQHDVRECWMVVQGKGILYVNDVERQITAGDFLYYDSQQAHQVYNPSTTESLIIYTVWW